MMRKLVGHRSHNAPEQQQDEDDNARSSGHSSGPSSTTGREMMGQQHSTKPTASSSNSPCVAHPSKNNTIAQQQRKKCICCGSKIFTARVLFILCLAGVAGGLGFAAYTFLTQSEHALAESQFHSVAERALAAAQAITRRKRMGAVSLAAIYAHQHASAQDWPTGVALEGFEEIASDLIDTSSGRGLAFIPLVYPDQVKDFETFAYDYYYHQRRPTYNETIAVSNFGRGIYAKEEPDLAVTDTDRRIHDTSGNTTWGGKHHFLAPIFEISGPCGSGAHNLLMFNHYSLESRGALVDDMLACADQRAASGNRSSCTTLSDVVFILNQPDKPGAVIFEPIYPANDPFQVAGYISSSIIWAEVLQNVFSEEVSGIEVVLETATQNHTYYIENGNPTYIGNGTGYFPDRVGACGCVLGGMNVSLTGESIFTSDSVDYTLRLYPTAVFFETYGTRNPMMATVGAVVIIIFTSLAFLVYDFLVRQEFHDAQAVLDAKRQFMRYVSHEVRTPLNTVVMGIKLLQEEIELLIQGPTTPPPPPPLDDNEQDSNSDKTSDRPSSVFDLSNQILGSAETAVSVLTMFLNYDKIESGELPLEITIIPIWNLIEKTMVEFIMPFKAKKVNLQLCFGGALHKRNAAESGAGHDDDDIESQREIHEARFLPREAQERRVVGDAIRITQVLRNLLSNALKFTPEGGSVTIEVSLNRPSPKKAEQKSVLRDKFLLHNCVEDSSFERDGEVHVTVRDDGVGITEDQMVRLFQSGVQFNVNELQAGKGSGLGLFIAKGICERHGGSLTAESQGANRGTAFTFRLPVHHVPDEALPDQYRRLKLGTSSVTKKADVPRPGAVVCPESAPPADARLRILVVDDAAMNRKLLARLLVKRGHEADQAEDGQVAVDLVKQALANQHPYDCILLDWEMPVMKGPDAAKCIRKDLCCDTFIGGVTGNVLPADVAYFKQCGANWVFPKPIRLPDLEAVWTAYGLIGGGGNASDCAHDTSTDTKSSGDTPPPMGRPLYPRQEK